MTEVPQVAFLAVAALLVAGALAALFVRGTGPTGHAANPAPAAAQPSRSSATNGATAPQVATSVLRGCPLTAADGGIAYVGPASHRDVTAYVAGQSKVLTACAKAAGGRVLFAVVSLAAAQTPDAAARVAGSSVGVLAGYALLPGDLLPRILPLGGGRQPVTASAVVLRHAFAAAAGTLGTDARAQDRQAAGITATDPAMQAFKADYLKAAAADRAAQAGLVQGCGCVYGLLVEAKVSALRALANTTGVRVVELAPPGTVLDGITARPVLVSERTETGDFAPPTPLPGS